MGDDDTPSATKHEKNASHPQSRRRELEDIARINKVDIDTVIAWRNDWVNFLITPDSKQKRSDWKKRAGRSQKKRNIFAEMYLAGQTTGKYTLLYPSVVTPDDPLMREYGPSGKMINGIAVTIFKCLKAKSGEDVSPYWYVLVTDKTAANQQNPFGILLSGDALLTAVQSSGAGAAEFGGAGL